MALGGSGGGGGAKMGRLIFWTMEAAVKAFLTFGCFLQAIFQSINELQGCDILKGYFYEKE